MVCDPYVKIKHVKLLTGNLILILSERKRKVKSISCSFCSQTTELLP